MVHGYPDDTGVPSKRRLRSHPSNLIRLGPAKGVSDLAQVKPYVTETKRHSEPSPLTPRALTIATSDSGGGAGVQADLKAFAAAGAHGMSALVALTAQSTVSVTAIHELPAPFVTAQIAAVFDDLGV